MKVEYIYLKIVVDFFKILIYLKNIISCIIYFN